MDTRTLTAALRHGLATRRGSKLVLCAAVSGVPGLSIVPADPGSHLSTGTW